MLNKIVKRFIIIFYIITVNAIFSQTQVNVTLKNVHNGVNISGSTLGVDGVNPSIPSGSAVLLNSGTTYTIRTNHKMFTNEVLMHHDWNGNFQKYLMHKSYNVPANDFEQDANFILYKNAAIESSTGTLDGLQIHDPWYRDASGYQPDDFRPLNIVAPDGTHEVFEGQQITTINPYYELKASETVNTTEHNESLTWYFEKWLSPNGLASIQNPTSLSTPVVFNADNAQIKARFKAHLASQNPNLFGDSRGRKVTIFHYGNTFEYMVYQDNGEIYFTKINSSGEWQEELKISDGSGQNHSPSISSYIGGGVTAVVWQKGNQILYRRLVCESWDTIKTITTTEESNAKPLVYV